MADFSIDVRDFDKLQKAMQDFQGNTEEAINEVLHNEASLLIQEEIKRLMPVSGKSWAGKKPAAKTAKSLTDLKGNLSVTVTTSKNYGYLYFPDCGENTRRHRGEQHFFQKGGENASDEIVERCIAKLVQQIERK